MWAKLSPATLIIVFAASGLGKSILLAGLLIRRRELKFTFQLITNSRDTCNSQSLDSRNYNQSYVVFGDNKNVFTVITIIIITIIMDTKQCLR